MLTILSATSISFAQQVPLIEWDTIHQPVLSDGGVVASQEHRASQVGAEILARGGNAIDAAVAIGFAKSVTLPKAGNLGGGGFMLIYLAKENKTVAIDYREMAPLAATKDMFLSNNGQVDKRKARFSTQSAGVPGTVAGLLDALERYGTLSREVVLAPAVQLAEKGFQLDHPFLESLEARKGSLISDNEVKRIYFKKNGASYAAGERVSFSDLAWSLKAIQKDGKKAFYNGVIADKFVRYMKDNGGLITHKDLNDYRAIEREAVVGSYRGYQVISMPPPSSGGIHIIQALNILENFDLEDLGYGSASSIHLMTEVFRRVYADRSLHLGDPDFVKIPAKQLLSKRYAKKLSQSISMDKATLSSDILPTEFHDHESDQTTHFSVIDQWGNIVSNTYTLNFSFGSGKIVTGTGIFLNNEMDDFSAKAGVPNAYGLIGGQANAIESKKRPLSSMSPTIVLKNNRPALVTGSPGGSRIITAVLHQIVNVLDFKMNIAQSAHSPRFHHQWYPDILRLEQGFSPDTIKILKKMGHKVEIGNAFGSVHNITQVNEQLYGASDPRRSGAQAIGVMKDGTFIYF